MVDKVRTPAGHTVTLSSEPSGVVVTDETGRVRDKLPPGEPPTQLAQLGYFTGEPYDKANDPPTPTLERVVIVPDVDNDGTSLEPERAAIEEELLNIAGGFTSDRVQGGWRGENGRCYRDSSTRYTLGVDAATDAAIVARLPEWCARLRQLALFTASRPCDVSFVTPPTETRVA